MNIIKKSSKPFLQELKRIQHLSGIRENKNKSINTEFVFLGKSHSHLFNGYVEFDWYVNDNNKFTIIKSSLIGEKQDSKYKFNEDEKNQICKILYRMAAGGWFVKWNKNLYKERNITPYLDQFKQKQWDRKVK